MTRRGETRSLDFPKSFGRVRCRKARKAEYKGKVSFCLLSFKQDHLSGETSWVGSSLANQCPKVGKKAVSFQILPL